MAVKIKYIGKSTRKLKLKRGYVKPVNLTDDDKFEAVQVFPKLFKVESEPEKKIKRIKTKKKKQED